MVLSKSRHQISVGKKKLEINRSSKVNSHVSLSFFQDPCEFDRFSTCLSLSLSIAAVLYLDLRPLNSDLNLLAVV